MKTVWNEKSLRAWSFYCPVCRANRIVTQKPSLKSFHYLQIFLTAGVFTLVTWHWFSWRGMVSFFPFWIVFEFFYRTRVRIALSCPHCGFDPYLYLADARWARDEMETHWRKKFEQRGIPFPEKDPVITGPNPSSSEPMVDRKGGLTEIL